MVRAVMEDDTKRKDFLAVHVFKYVMLRIQDQCNKVMS